MRGRLLAVVCLFVVAAHLIPVAQAQYQHPGPRSQSGPQSTVDPRVLQGLPPAYRDMLIADSVPANSVSSVPFSERSGFLNRRDRQPALPGSGGAFADITQSGDTPIYSGPRPPVTPRTPPYWDPAPNRPAEPRPPRFDGATQAPAQNSSLQFTSVGQAAKVMDRPVLNDTASNSSDDIAFVGAIGVGLAGLAGVVTGLIKRPTDSSL